MWNPGVRQCGERWLHSTDKPFSEAVVFIHWTTAMFQEFQNDLHNTEEEENQLIKRMREERRECLKEINLKRTNGERRSGLQ